jgi:hypothetical protein
MAIEISFTRKVCLFGMFIRGFNLNTFKQNISFCTIAVSLLSTIPHQPYTNPAFGEKLNIEIIQINKGGMNPPIILINKKY